MRTLCTLLLLLLTVACATPARLVVTATDTPTTVGAAADDLVAADVVALGELHETPPVHEMHHALLEALHERRGNVVIAMEMFERDVQTVLLQYLTGFIDEPTFLAKARPWGNYARDYRPVIEFAKANGLVVLAANAPRELAAKASKQGVLSVLGDRLVARETTAPEDEYWDDFKKAMKDHGGTDNAPGMKNFYAAQCLKDDTMAESIVDHLLERRKSGDRPLVVLFCGRMHSDHGRGTVARIKSRMPDLDVRVLSAEVVEGPDKKDMYASPVAVGDYVVVAHFVRDEKVTSVAAKQPAATGADAGKPANPSAAASNPEGTRPALGLMADYGHQGTDGVLVATVREGGSADKAGIEAGDFIVQVGDQKVTDVESYTEALDAQIIGRTITVRVRREAAEVDLQVVVASRSR